jgi:transposase
MEAKADLQAHPLGPRPKGKRVRGNSPRFDLRTELYRVTGVDWTRVDGIDVQVAQTVIAEVGTDLRSFPGEKHFSKWLGLCPMNETSGGKVLKRRTPRVANRAATALRQAACALLPSQSYFGAQYRRLRTRLGAPKAITAMARKLACLFYRLLTKGQQYVDKGMEYYESRYREKQVLLVTRRAHQLGLQVVTPEGQTSRLP